MDISASIQSTVVLSPLNMEGNFYMCASFSGRRFVYPPFASAGNPVRITDLAGRKGWGTHGRKEGCISFPALTPSARKRASGRAGLTCFRACGASSWLP
jgi:hypothetical protein